MGRREYEYVPPTDPGKILSGIKQLHEQYKIKNMWSAAGCIKDVKGNIVRGGVVYRQTGGAFRSHRINAAGIFLVRGRPSRNGSHVIWRGNGYYYKSRNLTENRHYSLAPDFSTGKYLTVKVKSGAKRGRFYIFTGKRSFNSGFTDTNGVLRIIVDEDFRVSRHRNGRDAVRFSSRDFGREVAL